MVIMKMKLSEKYFFMWGACVKFAFEIGCSRKSQNWFGIYSKKEGIDCQERKIILTR